MCHYVTIVLPADVKLEEAQAIAKKHHRGFERVQNRTLAGLLRPGEILVLTTHGHCDCGTSLGMALRPDLDRSESDMERRTKEFRKKGWSESKISRWVEQKQHTVERNTRVMNQRRGDLRLHPPDDAQQWIDFLREIVSSGTTAYCGILYHWYSGALESERISLRNRTRRRIGDLTADDLLTLEEDVLLEVGGR